MKLWKVRAAAAAVAALVPYKVEKDEETGEIRAQALLWSANHQPNPEDGGNSLTVNIGPSLPAKAGEDEADLYDDEVILVQEAIVSQEAPAQGSGEEAAPAREDAGPQEAAAPQENAGWQEDAFQPADPA